MAGFNHFLTKHHRALLLSDEIQRNKAITLRKGDKSIFFGSRNLSILSPQARVYMDIAFENTANIIEIFLYSEICRTGPKIFQPKQIDFEMLEQMSLNITFGDYNQPYETIIIDLPENYCKSKSVDCPQHGDDHYGLTITPQHEPQTVILYFNKELEVLLVSVFFSTEMSIKIGIPFKPDAIIDDHIIFQKHEQFEGTMETSSDEDKVVMSIIRSALNYSLLLDEVGTRKIGPNNPSYYNRLIKHRNNNIKNPQKLRGLNFDLKIHPVIYELNQTVELYKIVNHSSELPSEPTGKKISPHHRKGHYRIQHYGPNNSLRKRIRIPAVFVNTNLFLGKMMNARATYS